MISTTTLRSLFLAFPALVVVLLVCALGAAVSHGVGDAAAGLIFCYVAAAVGLLTFANLVTLLLAVVWRQIEAPDQSIR